MTDNLKERALAEAVANVASAPNEMENDIDERLSDLEAAFPWVKTYVDGLGEKIKVLEAKLSRIEDASSESSSQKYDGLQSAYWSPGDENLNGDDSPAMEFDMTIVDTGKKVAIATGRVVLDGGDTYWKIAGNTYAISGSEYVWPTIVKEINSNAPAIQIISSGYPVPTSTNVYRPLGRLKSNNGGATWSIDTGIMWHGTVFLTMPIVYE